jgi:hypothetical protein
MTLWWRSLSTLAKAVLVVLAILVLLAVASRIAVSHGGEVTSGCPVLAR